MLLESWASGDKVPGPLGSVYFSAMAMQVQNYCFMLVGNKKGYTHTERMVQAMKEDCGDPSWIKAMPFQKAEDLLLAVSC